MPIYKFGYVVKSRREALGYTQEELADGICSVPTLSRIENGERMPSKGHYEMLLQRLGYSDTVLYEHVDERTLALHELKFKIRQAVILRKPAEARRLLAEYKESCEESSLIDQQFVLLHDVLSTSGKYSTEERLERLEKAIRLTCPKYDENKYPKILSYEEIVILNNIAGCYLEMQKIDKAIQILYFLKQYYESKMTNMEEILRTQPMVLYNLSKCLGLAGRYDECIEICDLGIKIARETGRCNTLAPTLYNRAWALVRRGRPGDMEQAEESAKSAVDMARVMGNDTSAERYLHFMKTSFSKENY